MIKCPAKQKCELRFYDLTGHLVAFFSLVINYKRIVYPYSSITFLLEKSKFTIKTTEVYY